MSFVAIWRHSVEAVRRRQLLTTLTSWFDFPWLRRPKQSQPAAPEHPEAADIDPFAAPLPLSPRLLHLFSRSRPDGQATVRTVPFSALPESLARSRLDVLLGGLSFDRRDDQEIAEDLLDAIEDFLLHHAAPWTDNYGVLVGLSRFLRQVAEVSVRRDVLEVHAWRLAFVGGLPGAQELPWPPALDRSGRLDRRDLTLWWCRCTLDQEPWRQLDLRPLRRLVDGSREPLIRALWRVATRSGIDQLSARHRRALHQVDHPLGVARLAIEEAFDLERCGKRCDALDTLGRLLHDPILQHFQSDRAFELLGRVYLCRAQRALETGHTDQASEMLGFWRALAAERPIAAGEQQVEAARIRAVLELEAGEIVSAADRIARSVCRLAREKEVPHQLQAEVFALAAEPLLQQRHFDDAVGMLEKALAILVGQKPVPPRLHLDLVRQLGNARWIHCVHDLSAAGLHAEDPYADAVGEAMIVHRPRLRALRRELRDLAPAVLSLPSAHAVAIYRWNLGRSLVFDDPHQALALLRNVVDDLMTLTLDCPLFEIALDLLVPLRLLGWSRADILAAEPLCFVLEIEPNLRPLLTEILDGTRHPLYGLRPELRKRVVPVAEVSATVH